MVDIVVINPARSGSKFLFDKNIKELSRYSLIKYSIYVSRLLRKIDKEIVSSNSSMSEKVSKQYCAEVSFIRPDQFSTVTQCIQESL